MFVRVRHPAPVRLVPTGGRHERVVLAACETEAAIPELDRSAFEPIGVSVGETDLMLREDGLWGPLPIRPEHRGDLPDAPAVLSAWLAGEPVGRIVDRLMTGLFRRTPFCAVDPAADIGYGKADHDRTGKPLGTVRELRRDLRGPVAQGVRDELARNFAIVEGRVLQRLDPMARPVSEGTPSRTRLQLVLRPHAHANMPVACGIDMTDALLEFLRLDAAAIERDLVAVTDALWARGVPSGDRAWFVDEHAALVHGAVLAAGKAFPTVERLAEHGRDLAPLADLALSGIAGRSEDPRAVERIRDAAAFVVPYLPRGYPSRGRVGNIPGIADRVLTAVPEPEADDVAALSGLAR